MDDVPSVPKEVINILRQASTGVIADSLALIGFQGGSKGFTPPEDLKRLNWWGRPVRSSSDRRGPTRRS